MESIFTLNIGIAIGGIGFLIGAILLYFAEFKEHKGASYLAALLQGGLASITVVASFAAVFNIFIVQRSQMTPSVQVVDPNYEALVSELGNRLPTPVAELDTDALLLALQDQFRAQPMGLEATVLIFQQQGHSFEQATELALEQFFQQAIADGGGRFNLRIDDRAVDCDVEPQNKGATCS